MHNAMYCPEHNPILGVAWSLEVEVQFYLVAPFIAAVLYSGPRVRRRIVLVAVVVLPSAGVAGMRRAGFGCIGYNLVGQFAFFAAGMLLADIYSDEWRGVLPKPSRWWDLLAIPGWVVVPELIWGRHILPGAALPLLLFVLAYASLKSVYLRSFLRWTPVVIVGGMCYTIYLVHAQLMHATVHVVGTQLLLPTFAASVLAYSAAFAVPIVTCSLAFFLLVEKPCMKRDWPRRVARALFNSKKTDDQGNQTARA